MAKQHKSSSGNSSSNSSGKPSGKSDKRSASRPALAVGARRTQSGGTWTLTHPKCAREISEDLEEVRTMIEQGEVDIAIDELRWLIETCRESIDAHRLLGELILSEDNDPSLARAHFGLAYQLGLKALRRAGNPTPLPYRLPANQAFFEAGKGLALCLQRLGKNEMAVEPLEQLLRFDPSDPLNLRGMLDTEAGDVPEDTEGEDAKDNE